MYQLKMNNAEVETQELGDIITIISLFSRFPSTIFMIQWKSIPAIIINLFILKYKISFKCFIYAEENNFYSPSITT